MSQICEYTIGEISQQPVGQIPWGTLMTVIPPKSKYKLLEELPAYLEKKLNKNSRD